MSNTFYQNVTAQLTPESASSDVFRFVKELSKEHLSVLTANIRVSLNPAQKQYLSDTAAQKFAAAIKDKKALTTVQLQEIWHQIFLEYLKNHHWQVEDQKDYAYQEIKEAPSVNFGLKLIWTALNSAIIMKTIVYYYGLRSSNDPTLENQIYFGFFLTLSFASLIYFAWKNHKKYKG